MIPPAVSVSSILRRIKGGLNRLGFIRIEGEVHSIKPYPSGHVYLDLKDREGDAQLHCVIWRRTAFTLKSLPRQGQAVVLTGTLDVFENRGQLQFNVTDVEDAGEGALFARFEALKRKLLAEGLFEAAVKKPLPRYPRAVGVVTSSETAALQDVMKTRARLAPWVPFVLYHASVQGEASEAEILAALDKAAGENRVDVLLLVRGGGSLADLWSFNSEAIARRLRRMPMPVVTGVGHETDFTIADMAVDLRAPTPTAACSIVLQHWAAAPQELASLERRLAAQAKSRLMLARAELMRRGNLRAAAANLFVRLRAALPQERDLRRSCEHALDLLTERLDRSAMALEAAARGFTQTGAAQLAVLEARLKRARPAAGALNLSLQQKEQLLTSAFAYALKDKSARLEQLAAALNALDVSQTLRRGFTLATDASGRRVAGAAALKKGDALHIHFADGSVLTQVQEISRTK